MKAKNKRTLTELYARSVRPEAETFLVWDAKQPGLALRVRPTGRKTYKFIYNLRKPRWLTIGDVGVGLANARRIAARHRIAVIEGRDPAAEKQAQRGANTFAELAQRYVEEHAKQRNKSWEQAAYLVERHLLPRWGKLNANLITRKDVRAVFGQISTTAPVVANQVLAAASAIFSWAVKMEVVSLNPVRGIERNPTQSRERVLSDSEIQLFWPALTPPLRLLLLLGQRPGEIQRMRREHIADGWWQLPGAPDPKTGWPGTKNKQTHLVWLPQAVQEIISTADSGLVFPRGHLDAAMRDICSRLAVENKITPHDLRRTHGTMITKLGFGRDAMNRIQNHKEGGIADVYDRHKYEAENKRVMEAVA